MTDSQADQLKQTVESLHGGTATLIQLVPVHEKHHGATVWKGNVHVFFLENSPSRATQAYAWASPATGGQKHKFFAVLHNPPLDSPLKAVRAAIATETHVKK